MRSGTENIPGIVGMTTALEDAVNSMGSNTEYLKCLQERMISGVLAIPGVQLTGDPENRLPGFCSFVVEGIPHSVYVVNEMNERGVCVSSGSACSARCSRCSGAGFPPSFRVDLPGDRGPSSIRRRAEAISAGVG